MNAPSSKAKSLFLNAVEIADPGERRAYLDDECADDEGLRREIEDSLHELEAGRSARSK